MVSWPLTGQYVDSVPTLPKKCASKIKHYILVKSPHIRNKLTNRIGKSDDSTKNDLEHTCTYGENFMPPLFANEKLSSVQGEPSCNSLHVEHIGCGPFVCMLKLASLTSCPAEPLILFLYFHVLCFSFILRPSLVQESLSESSLSH
jgi:hypothetical protein